MAAVADGQPEPEQLTGGGKDPYRGVRQRALARGQLQVEVRAPRILRLQRQGRCPHPQAQRLELGQVVAARQDVGPAGGEEILSVHEEHRVFGEGDMGCPVSAGRPPASSAPRKSAWR